MSQIRPFDEPYGGRRILEAMRSAKQYASEIYRTMRRISLRQGARILDFGAGDGVFFEKFVSEGFVPDCLEPDASLADVLRSAGAAVYSNADELHSNSYDFVYAINVLEHIARPDETLAEIMRTLKSGAYLFVFVPAFEVLWTSLDDECLHLRRYTRSSLSRLVVDAGFEVQKCDYFDSLGFPAALAVKLLETVGLFQYSPRSVGIYDKALFPASRQLDHLIGGRWGKNVVAVSRKP